MSEAPTRYHGNYISVPIIENVFISIYSYEYSNVFRKIVFFLHQKKRTVYNAIFQCIAIKCINNKIYTSRKKITPIQLFCKNDPLTLLRQILYFITRQKFSFLYTIIYFSLG